MKSRWLSTFTVIGIILLALGVYGLIMQHGGRGFVFDPGQLPSADGPDRTPWYYLVIGALMVLNGLVTPAPAPAEAVEKPQSDRKNVSGPGASASVKNPRTSGSRAPVATSADKPGE